MRSPAAWPGSAPDLFLIRPASPDDLDSLMELAKLVNFTNLPPVRDIIAEKIRRSLRSFGGEVRDDMARAVAKPASGLATDSPLFMFVLEHSKTGRVIGTSQVVARMGGPGRPNFAMRLRRRDFFSEDLQCGATHVTGQLVLDESGPTEIGGLIVDPSYRGHAAKLGKQLALVRFHFIALHRKLFADRVLAEMMAPITSDGHNAFWDAFGRAFINLSYAEADRFCQCSREFMAALLPREEIYLSLLPAAARRCVGAVHEATVPARRMLEHIGFRYHDMIDPFDGGPHLECPTDEISVVEATSTPTLLGPIDERALARRGQAIVSVDNEDGASESFRAVCCSFAEHDDGVRIPAAAIELLGARANTRVGFTVLEALPAKSPSEPRRQQPRGGDVPIELLDH